MTEDMFEAQGYAQMQSHGDLILRLYGQARGRAAEYWGEGYLASDIRVHTLSVPALAASWADDQDPEMAAYLGAFAQGMNRYAEEHPEALDPEVARVLPVGSEDVMAHLLRVIHFNFVSNPGAVGARFQERLLDEALGDPDPAEVATGPGGRPEGAFSSVALPNDQPPGSNAWAIGPSRSESGHALLLANPHLPWGDFFTWYENHLVGPDVDAYGVTLVGMPLVTIGFSDHLGWTHTVNTYDGSDVYELDLQDEGYLFDGEVRPFEVREETIQVRKSDDSLVERTLIVRRSVHGPVVGLGDRTAYALRVAGLDRPQVFRQYFEMLTAENLQEFEEAMGRMQMPMFTTMYADVDGHIMHFFNGLVPVRGEGDFDYWYGTVPGGSSETLWTEYHSYEELPKAIDPESGWLQNANDPPWTTTFPQPPGMDPDRYPAYMAPQSMSLRAQSSAGMLMEDESITFEEFVEYKHSTRMELGRRLREELVSAALRAGGEAVLEAAQILEDWDGNADVGSRGAVLFLEWAQSYYRQTRGQLFSQPWDPEAPMETPRGLSDADLAVAVLVEAADAVRASYGSLDVPYGEVYRVRRDAVDLPGNGASGIAGVFRAAGYAPAEEGRYELVGGDTFVMAVEFGEPIQAMAVMGYGNASQAGSPHRTDQVSLFSEKRMRPVWRTKEDVEANLGARRLYKGQTPTP
jgi:acyl-homoserine-lactone acylase